MTEKDKIIQDQAIEINRLKTTIDSMKTYIELLEKMVASNNEARDVTDFEG